MAGKVVRLPGVRRRRPRIPAAPAHVTGLAAEEWRRVARILAGRGDLDAAVLGTLECYCVQYAAWREAQAHVGQHGPVVPAPRTGVPSFNQFWTAANKASELMLRFAGALKITPARRTAAPAGPDGNGDGWDSDLLA